MMTTIVIDTQTQAIDRKHQAAQKIADHFRPQIQQYVAKRNISISEFASDRFYIPETGDPIILMPHQAAILNYALDPKHPYTHGGTIVYSTVKKSGKTAIASLVARYITETWGTSNEVYMMANDLEQARGRSYAKLLDSIELDPSYDKKTAANGWKIIEKSATFEPTRSVVKALSNDYRGEAGSNPTATFWSELWGYTSEVSKRFWEELTPVPTRTRSVRYVETYAGFEDESELLLELYTLGMKGRRLTHDDIDWPFPDEPPIWVNDEASIFMYWDSGEVARRMPWQTPKYYQTQATSLRPNAFDRLHSNLWTSSTEAFMPTEWWEYCRQQLPPLDPNTPIVLGVDASVSGDCFAIVGVSRNPDPALRRYPMLRYYNVWYPEKGIPLNHRVQDRYIRDNCAVQNIVEITYDQYQLHKMMTDIALDGIAWCRPFSQAGDREIADKILYDLIRDRQIAHNAGPEFTEHIRGASAKTSATDKNRMRIVKKNTSMKIDLLVAASMAVSECLRLNL